MDVTEATIRLIFLILPGVLSAVLIEQLTIHKPWTQFRFILHAFILGVLNYLVLQLVLFIPYFIGRWYCPGIQYEGIQFWNSMFDKSIALKSSEIFWACIVGVLVGLLLSKAIQDKWIFKLASRLKVSGKYGDENLFMFFLNAQEVNWVYVRDIKNKITYFGLRKSFSETDHIREIVLTDVTVYSMVDSKEMYKMPAIYLSYEVGNLIIELPEQ